jgi:hypothetical protein
VRGILLKAALRPVLPECSEVLRDVLRRAMLAVLRVSVFAYECSIIDIVFQMHNKLVTL